MVIVRDKYELEKLRMSSVGIRDLDVEQMSVDARRLWSRREVVIKEIDDEMKISCSAVRRSTVMTRSATVRSGVMNRVVVLHSVKMLRSAVQRSVMIIRSAEMRSGEMFCFALTRSGVMNRAVET